MGGTRITATKLGLCAMVAHLADNDRISISKFNEHVQSCTPGFITISEITPLLPGILSGIQETGRTAAFDGVVSGVQDLKAFAEFADDGAGYRYVEFVLTDGQDNSSKHSLAETNEIVQHPGFAPFMFVMVAVGMEGNTRSMYQPLVEMPHCKMLSVGVRTGHTLFRTLKEVLVQRISRDVIERQVVAPPIAEALGENALEQGETWPSSPSYSYDGEDPIARRCASPFEVHYSSGSDGEGTGSKPLPAWSFCSDDLSGSDSD